VCTGTPGTPRGAACGEEYKLCSSSLTQFPLTPCYLLQLRSKYFAQHPFISCRGKRIFPAATVTRPAVGPTQPPIQWVLRVLFPGLKRGRGVTLTTHPHLVPRSRMSTSYIFSLPSAFMECGGTALAFNPCIRHLQFVFFT
jgi:hypothetical protein